MGVLPAGRFGGRVVQESVQARRDPRSCPAPIAIVALKRDDQFSAVAFSAPVGRRRGRPQPNCVRFHPCLAGISERARHRFYCDNFVAGQSRRRDDQTIPEVHLLVLPTRRRDPWGPAAPANLDPSALAKARDHDAYMPSLAAASIMVTYSTRGAQRCCAPR